MNLVFPLISTHVFIFLVPVSSAVFQKALISAFCFPSMRAFSLENKQRWPSLLPYISVKLRCCKNGMGKWLQMRALLHILP